MNVQYSVLIPVYNEEDILEEKIAELRSYLDKNCPGYRIIVCSNGSEDQTDEIGKTLQDNVLEFISIDERGVGNAFKQMVAHADTEKLVSIDVDLSSDLSFIPECVRLLDEYDTVVGSKKKGEQERRWHRTFISNAFISMVKTLLGLTYTDYSIGTKGWKRSWIVDDVKSIDHGSSYVIELIYKVKQKGANIVEVPVYCSDTRGSKFNILHEIVYRFMNLIRFWITKKRSP